MAIPTRTEAPRRRWLLLAFCLLDAALVAGGVYLFVWEPEYRGALVNTPSRTQVFAHRGFGELGPDNSLFAAERALEAGMDGVDVDGQMTRDGVLCYGAIGVGGTKMKLHKAAIARLFERNDQVLDAEEVYALAPSL